MDSFIDIFVRAARTVAIEHHGYVEEVDGTLLAPDTIKLVNEIEEMNRQRKIDEALVNGDRKLFMQLTGGE